MRNDERTAIQWNLRIKDMLGPAICPLYREIENALVQWASDLKKHPLSPQRIILEVPNVHLPIVLVLFNTTIHTRISYCDLIWSWWFHCTCAL